MSGRWYWSDREQEQRGQRGGFFTVSARSAQNKKTIGGAQKAENSEDKKQDDVVQIMAVHWLFTVPVILLLTVLAGISYTFEFFSARK